MSNDRGTPEKSTVLFDLDAGASRAPSLAAFVAYFLRLGTFGFGGPIALAGSMQRDLVEDRGWVTKDEYVKGLALAQLAPGPLAAQLAIYLGWARAGVSGATLVALAFVLPSFLMVIAISVAYVRFGGLAWMQSAFYGIGAAVIAIILRSAYKLVRLTLGRDWLLWMIFVTNAIATAAMEAEVVSLIVCSGVATLAVQLWKSRTPAALSIVPPFALAASGSAIPTSGGTLFWFFAKAGAFVFGSGLAIVPFLYGGVVREHGWLTDQQFLDAVAVAMITPGPVVITVAFIGYLVQGLGGASLAALGVFLPCYLFVVIPAPFYARFADNPRLKAFVAGVTAGATGAIAGAVYVLARRAIVDLPTILIFAATLACLVWLKRVPEPVVIAIVGIASVLFRAA
jgi:chromate transporter